MNPQISLVGLNHRTASVDIREKFALADFLTPEKWAIPKIGSMRESLILSTCNRVEVIGIGIGEVENLLLENWAKTCNASLPELKSYVYIHKGLEAARHIFEVASSLDSMVLGEPQILGQLKAAYRHAIESGNTGAILNRLMHKAFSVAKRVRNETAIAASAVSISYAAVELAKRIFGDMANHTAIIIGAGEMAELAGLHLGHAGIREIMVINRTFENGQALANRINGRPLPFNCLEASLREADIVIASTGSREPLICAKDLKKTLKARKNRPMFLIDIAVPRDIDPDVNNLDNVYLYDIDDLKEVVEENMASRKEEAAKARIIIDGEVELFAKWLDNLQAQPTIIDIINRGEEAARTELARVLKHMGNIDPQTKKAMEFMANAIARKLNHDPIMFLKENEDSHATLERINMVRRIFNLDGHARYSHRN